MYTFSAWEKWKTSLVRGHTTLSSWRMESRDCERRGTTGDRQRPAGGGPQNPPARPAAPRPHSHCSRRRSRWAASWAGCSRSSRRQRSCRPGGSWRSGPWAGAAPACSGSGCTRGSRGSGSCRPPCSTAWRRLRKVTAHSPEAETPGSAGTQPEAEEAEPRGHVGAGTLHGSASHGEHSHGQDGRLPHRQGCPTRQRQRVSKGAQP